MEKFRLEDEYSLQFDELRKNRVEMSFYKYGPVRKNYGTGNVQALPTAQLCLRSTRRQGILSICAMRQTI